MVGQPVGTHDAHLPLLAWHVSQRYGAAPGLEVSPGDVLKDLLVQAEFSYQPLQLAVFLLQFLQPFRLVHLQAAVFLAPAVVGLLGDAAFPARDRSRLAVCNSNLDLPKQAHNLFRCMLLALRHLPLLFVQSLSLELVQKRPGTPQLWWIVLD